jgi:hypothetical protein
MLIKEEFRDAREKFKLLSLYQRFEHIAITILTALIAIIVVVVVWNLTRKIMSASFCQEISIRPTTRSSRPCLA